MFPSKLRDSGIWRIAEQIVVVSATAQNLLRMWRVAGAIFLLYGFAFLDAPNLGVAAWIYQKTGISSEIYGFAFLVSGMIMLISPPRAKGMIFCTLPLTFYTMAGLFQAASNSTLPITSVIGHFGFWLMVQLALWQGAKTEPVLKETVNVVEPLDS